MHVCVCVYVCVWALLLDVIVFLMPAFLLTPPPPTHTELGRQMCVRVFVCVCVCVYSVLGCHCFSYACIPFYTPPPKPTHVELGRQMCVCVCSMLINVQCLLMMTMIHGFLQCPTYKKKKEKKLGVQAADSHINSNAT